MRPLSSREQLLHDRLELLYRTYGPETVASDPVVFLTRYESAQDREVAGWISSAFAYGRVETIQASVGRILAALGPHPAREIGKIADFRAFARERLPGFKHRFHSGEDAALLLYAVREAIAQEGSIRAFFEAEYLPEERDVAGLLSRAVARLLAFDYRPVLGKREIPRRAAARFFFPDPAAGSACKRWNLYLRWMVRKDRLDYGQWPGIPTDRLVIPTDTHIHLIARRLGLTRRRSADWATAREITDRLARLDAKDPVRFDYALCRVGIFGVCRTDLRLSRCGECLAADACPAGRARISRTGSRVTCPPGELHDTMSTT